MKEATWFASHEAIPLTDWLSLPNMHINFYRREDGVCVAHCLDFDLYAYSSFQNNEEAVEDCFSDIAEQASVFIFNNLGKGTPEKIYSNFDYSQVSGEFLDFSKGNNKLKAEKLYQSYIEWNKVMSENPESAITQLGEILGKLVNNLNSNEIDSVQSILSAIKNLKEENEDLQKINSKLIHEMSEKDRTIRSLMILMTKFRLDSDAKFSKAERRRLA